MRKLLLFAGFLALLLPQLQASDTLRVYNSLTIHDLCPNVNRLVMLLPCPESNRYQDVVGHRFSADGSRLLTEDDRSYLRFLYFKNQLTDLTEFTVSDTFDIVYKEISVPFETVDPNAQYDTQSDDYQDNLGNVGIYIQPQHPYIDSIANVVWASSDHSIRDYAYKCYEYVAQHLTYHLYSEGLLPLDTVIARQGGECGDFTTLLVNLLRNKNIPARHVAAFTSDGQYHVWAEFLLPGYGWVPVDATYKNGNPAGNFFGEYHEQYIVAHFGLNLSVNCSNGTYLTVVLLQSYAWWYWFSPAQCPDIDVTREVWGEPSPGPLFPAAITSTPSVEQLHVTVHDRQVDIHAPGSRRTDIFDVTGRLVARIHGECGSAHLNCGGIYILKGEGLPARKIMVK